MYLFQYNFTKVAYITYEWTTFKSEVLWAICILSGDLLRLQPSAPSPAICFVALPPTIHLISGHLNFLWIFDFLLSEEVEDLNTCSTFKELLDVVQSYIWRTIFAKRNAEEGREDTVINEDAIDRQ